MSRYVLDTDILSLYQQGNVAVRERIAQHQSEDLAVTIITVEEQLSSWYTMRRQVKGREMLALVYQRFTDNVRFLARLQILSFTEEAIDQYEQLRRSKLGVKGSDLRIAAIALSNSASVVTRNRTDFGRIRGLPIEDWAV